jgi:hypothetical protein
MTKKKQKKDKFVCYQATGVTTDGKRFKLQGGALYIAGINLWRGTKWGVRADGTRKKLAEVYN